MSAISSEKTVDLLKVQGFKASGIPCGIKKNGRRDLALILSDVPAKVAALFTTNGVKAAPVLIDIDRVKKGTARGVIINSGNANACTGKKGFSDAIRMTALAEAALGLEKGSVLVSSTGVIGVPLPVEKVEVGMKALVEGLSYVGLVDAGEAIMTTDAFMKTASASAVIGGRKVTIAGIAKGAGMICPNMATMLAYFVTDCDVPVVALRKALKEATDLSFNSIIVDNDTSTNDTTMVFANGLAGNRPARYGSIEYRRFVKLLTEVSTRLAHMIVKDGEGATRFIEIRIKRAASDKDARLAGRAMAESFLVKTAFFGGDPNWGRIMAAIGKASIKMDESKTDIIFNGVPVVKNGLDTGMEKEAAAAIKVREVVVTVDLRMGKGASTIWTTDLTYEYVKINSAYRT